MARLEGTRLILAVRNLRTATDFYVNTLGASSACKHRMVTA